MSRFLSSGSYGCVYKPALSCNTADADAPQAKHDHVSKVFAKGGHPALNRRFFEEEMQKNKKVKEINSDNSFTLTHKNGCLVPGEAFTEQEIQACAESEAPSWKPHVIRKMRDGSMPQIIYPYGGIPLSEFASQMRQAFSLETFLRDFRPIMHGLVKLQQHRHTHYDIKPENILYDIPQHKISLMDFGLLGSETWLYTKPQDNIEILAHPYPYYPPEFKIVARFCSPDVHLDDPDLFYKLHRPLVPFFSHFHRNIPLLEMRVRAAKDKIEKRLTSVHLRAQYKHVLLRFHHRTRQHQIQGFLERLQHNLRWTDMSYSFPKQYSMMVEFKKQRFGAKIDTYSTGITLLEILAERYFARSFSTLDASTHELMIEVLRVISGMIHPDPYERLTPPQAAEAYDDVLRRVPPHGDQRSP